MSEPVPVLSDLASMLRSMADSIDSLTPSLCLPQQEYTICEAFRKLRTALGNTYLNISPPQLNWHSCSPFIEADDWSVYDGNKHYRAKTLACAVNACLAAHAPAPVNGVEVVERALQECVPVPELPL